MLTLETMSRAAGGPSRRVGVHAWVVWMRVVKDVVREVVL